MKLLKLILLGLALVTGTGAGTSIQAAQPVLPHPILFVTQTPEPGDFTTVTSTFGSHRPDMDSAPRGGGLWIRYEDGTLKNLTLAAGFGHDGPQHTNGIAVREPCVHWNGTKAVFSMVVGAPKEQFDYTEFYWQLYEITNLASNQVPVITKVSNQPTNYNNIAPAYGSNGRIIFSSDRMRDGQRHLYPQLDEYEEAPTVTGLWSLDPANGNLFMLNHAPSGVFSPKVDSFGRVIFSRWDHMQRDQQADQDLEDIAVAPGTAGTYGTFNYSSEAANALVLTNNRTEVFPEPRYDNGNNHSHNFNQFFPWQINQNGTEEETLNHIGRHELGGSYRNVSFTDDDNITELYYFGDKPNTNTIENFFQPHESPLVPGYFYGIEAPEFSTHAAGQIVGIEGSPAISPEVMKVTYFTHPATASFNGDSEAPDPNHTGHYRNPLPLSDGRLASIHTPETKFDKDVGLDGSPKSRYDFRLKLLKKVGNYFVPDVALTSGITGDLAWWSPDSPVTYQGEMWELDPVEVRTRPVPPERTESLPSPEQTIFAQEGVDPENFQQYLRQRDLALIVSRNVTARDDADQIQPYNLRVPGGVQTLGAGGKVYDIQYLQLFQADLIRGVGLRDSDPRDGRRVLAQHQHEELAENVPTTSPTAPASSVKIAPDGSVAAMVPARRAMTWQTTAPAGEPMVRERYWVTFQPGEIRVCADCHGVNKFNQAGQGPSSNPPEALRLLLRTWKTNNLAVVSATNISNTVYPTVAFRRQTNTMQLKQHIEISTNLTTWTPVSTYTPTNATHTGTLVEQARTPGEHEEIVLRDQTPLTPTQRRFYRVITERQ